MAGNLRLTLTPAAEHAVRGGHPWVFANRIKSRNREGSSGELAVIYDRRDRFLAVGLYDAESPISVRILESGSSVKIDDAWFCRQMTTAVKKRQEFFDPDGASATTGYRWLNGESDGLPAVVMDRYGDVGVVKLYSTAWLPFVANGRLQAWIAASCPDVAIWVLRLSRNIQDAAGRLGLSDGDLLSGELSAAATPHFFENGVRFEAEPVQGQKTGFFLDQRDNRMRVRKFAHGTDVLNVFSHTGGFSVHAAAGGARSTTDLDISRHALAAAVRNMEINRDLLGCRDCLHETVKADAFEWLATMSRGGSSKVPLQTYDIVIIDPPSLAKRQSERERALKAYQRLATAGLQLVRKGGLLVTASCSAHVPARSFYDAIRQVIRRRKSRGHEIFTSGHAFDHPALIPEARYLKCLGWRVAD